MFVNCDTVYMEAYILLCFYASLSNEFINAHIEEESLHPFVAVDACEVQWYTKVNR